MMNTFLSRLSSSTIKKITPTFNSSYNASKGITTSSRLLYSGVYTVSLKTGDKLGAGTDSKIYIRMIGSLGSSDEVMLNTSKKELERGSIDHYNVPMEDVGPLRKIIIRHDSTGFAPGWYLDWVSIRDGKGEKYHFTHNGWLVKGDAFGNLKLLKEDTFDETTGLLRIEMEKPSEKDVDPFADSLEQFMLDIQENIVETPVEDEPEIDKSSQVDTIVTNNFNVVMQHTINVEEPSEASQINKLDIPHLYMSAICPIENFNRFCMIFDKRYPKISTNIMLVRILSKAFLETTELSMDSKESIDLLVTHNGNAVILERCNEPEVGSIYKKYKAFNGNNGDVVIPRYGLNIIDTNGVSELSTSLRVGQVLALTVSGIKLDEHGRLSKHATVAISCDSRVISNEACASLLVNCKNFLSDPSLLL